jgi:hypothetical protein
VGRDWALQMVPARWELARWEEVMTWAEEAVGLALEASRLVVGVTMVALEVEAAV